MSGINWRKRSEKHEEKFAKLTQLPRKKLIRIGTFYACFDKEFMIGEGRDGTCVYVGLSDDGNEVAVKRMLTHTCENLAENEKRILNMMKMEMSPHIVRYRYCTTDDSNTFTYLVLELCEGTLENYVASLKQEELDLSAPRLIREILTGLLTLHGTGKVVKILHKDLNPWNILVDVEGHMRLADFGVSRRLSEDSSTYNSAGNKGARYWRAVESVPVEEKDNRKVIYKRKSDIQVVGMLVYYILTKGGHPFGDEYNRVKNLIEGNPVDLDKLSNPSAKDLVSWMLQHKIEDRPYVEEALTHPYVQRRDRQFRMLVRFGNEPEIQDNDTNCDVVQQLNEDSSLKDVNWITMVDPEVYDHMKKFCRYKNSTASLVRFVRNAWEHWRDKKTPKAVQEKIKDPTDYLLTRFPDLPVVVHRIIRKKPDWMGRPGLKNFFQVQQ